jgi:hypothetical protein
MINMAVADMIRHDIIDLEPDEFIMMKTETPDEIKEAKIIPLAESDSRDDEIYEELAPEYEDALIRRLSFIQGVWDDE